MCQHPDNVSPRRREGEMKGKIQRNKEYKILILKERRKYLRMHTRQIKKN